MGYYLTLALIGLVAGFASAMLGIGGGVMTVPFLLWCAVPMRKAVGTAAACTLPVAVAGVIGFVIAGWEAGHGVDSATGYVWWPAVAGIAVGRAAWAVVSAASDRRVKRLAGALADEATGLGS